MSRRDWRYYRERQRAGGGAAGRAEERRRGGRGAAARGARAARVSGRRWRARRGGRPTPPRRARLPRRDLTELPTFTVDPATARDFDDAVSARREGDGVRLWIHIADVAAHVRPGSPLDLEARRRANSTYVPGAVEPMLPHALSEDACSLAPGVERLAVTAEIELAASGAPARGELLPQPHPLRRPPRLRPARRDLRRPREAARRRSPSRWRSPARPPRRSASGAARPASTSSPSSPSSASTPAATSAGARCGRPDRVPPADRAADDPRQRTGRAAARAQAGAGRSTASTPSPIRRGSSG